MSFFTRAKQKRGSANYQRDSRLSYLFILASKNSPLWRLLISTAAMICAKRPKPPQPNKRRLGKEIQRSSSGKDKTHICFIQTSTFLSKSWFRQLSKCWPINLYLVVTFIFCRQRHAFLFRPSVSSYATARSATCVLFPPSPSSIPIQRPYAARKAVA